jgi:hypothetical protein
MVLVAIGFNGSIVATEHAPAVMLAALVVTGIGILCCTLARTALNTYCACAAAFPACKSACSSVGALLTGVQAVLGIEAVACLTAALWAYIPFLGIGPMLVIFGTMIAEFILILGAILLLSQLFSCQGKIPPPPSSPGPGPAPKG